MKSSILFLIACVAGILVNGAEEQHYVLDGKARKVIWTGYGAAGSFEQEGTISIQSSELKIDENGLLEGQMVIDMKSIFHANKKLTKHLKNSDFFDVKKFPTAQLNFGTREDESVFCTLRLKGVDGDISINPDIEINDEQIRVKGVVAIDRTHYGIKYNSASYFQDLGNYAIKNEFDVAFDLLYVQVP